MARVWGGCVLDMCVRTLNVSAMCVLLHAYGAEFHNGVSDSLWPLWLPLCPNAKSC